MGTSRLPLARFEPPAVRTVARERVDRRLDRAWDVPLTVIVGPAGAGKTTAASHLVARSAGASLWYRAHAVDDVKLVEVFQAADVLQTFIAAAPRLVEDDVLDPLAEHVRKPGIGEVVVVILDLAAETPERARDQASITFATNFNFYRLSLLYLHGYRDASLAAGHLRSSAA